MRVLRRLRGVASGPLAALTIGLLAPAFAAENGIDCSKAVEPDEKFICADPEMIREDARMVTLFATAMGRSGMGERGDLQDGQTAWLDERRACKADAACLRAAYAARIARLQGVIDAAARAGDPF